MPNKTAGPIDSTNRDERGQPLKGPTNATANTRVDTTLDRNLPFEKQPSGSTDDDAMARSEQWADGTPTAPITNATRSEQARSVEPTDII
jgi:hypothetical protein